MTNDASALCARMPRVFTIAPTLPFLDVLAHGLLRRANGDPLTLSRMTVLLPTNRARLSLRDAFLRASGGRALLLPTIAPLGDLSAEWEPALPLSDARSDLTLPPALDGLRRTLLLAKLIRAKASAEGERLSADQSAHLAAELAHLMDEVDTEELSFASLPDLFPQDYQAHWQIVLNFLRIAMDHWPRILSESGMVNPMTRRRETLDRLAEAWRRVPPDRPVIAAGSTGSIPATARLLDVVSRLPSGEAILPGFDMRNQPEDWDAIAEDRGHPQYGMSKLVRGCFGIEPDSVADWPESVDWSGPRTQDARARLAHEAMRPASRADAWRDLAERSSRRLRAEELVGAASGVVRLDCRNEDHEARTAALIMRETLEEPDRTAALVTPNRNLARRVASALRRWGVEIDDSAGRPLASEPPAAFMTLCANAVAERVAPIPLLAALKHPLAVGARSPDDKDGRTDNRHVFLALVRDLETFVLRGARPASGFEGLLRAVRSEAGRRAERAGSDLKMAARLAELSEWIGEFAAHAKPLADLMERPAAGLCDLVEAHVRLCEALAGADRLWRGDAGEALARHVSDLREGAESFGPLSGGEYPALFGALLAGVPVRPQYGLHPRLFIWGPLEARLQRADVIILSSLNERSWPGEPRADPWMSRPMRRDFSLPAPERQIGLSAHDFVEGFCAPKVFLTRARREEGNPTAPSRWLLRLDAVLRAAGMEADAGDGCWPAWADALDRPTRTPRPKPPAPRPPVRVRPKSLSVTRIETWMRDPYSIYARYILKLPPLDPIDADPGAIDRGIVIHDALDKFLREPDDGRPRERLLALGREAFGELLERPGVRAFWWPRFERVADWFLARQAERKREVVSVHSEIDGEIEIDLGTAAAPFALRARADRIDELAGGTYEIIDYKTGYVPKPAEVAAGLASQLPLEAAILAGGGFARSGVPTGKASHLTYWRMSGGRDADFDRSALPERGAASLDVDAAAAAAVAGLKRLIAWFADEGAPYRSVPRPDLAPRFNDYDQLARIDEWRDAVGREGAAP